MVTLFCLVHGQSVSEAFPIDIETNRTVGHLKDEIKKKKTPRFDGIAADELSIWSVSAPFDEFAVLEPVLRDEEKLLPVKKIGHVFTIGFEDERIHVIVKAPARDMHLDSKRSEASHTMRFRFLEIIGGAGPQFARNYCAAHHLTVFSEAYTTTDTMVLRVRDPSGRLLALRIKRWENTKELLILLKMQDTPGVVKVVDFEFDKYYLVLLEEWLVLYDTVNASQAISITKDILGALVIMHNRDYRHNDIKPRNIGWSKEQQQWALFDFDFAERARDGDKYIESTMGTFGFMAPEALEGERSSKTDIFSLGACVMNMCDDTSDHPDLNKLLKAMTSEWPETRPSAKEALRAINACRSNNKSKRHHDFSDDDDKENKRPCIYDLTR